MSKAHSNLVTDFVLLAMFLPLVGWRVLAVGALAGVVVAWLWPGAVDWTRKPPPKPDPGALR